MIGGVEWRDKSGTPYGNQRVAYLRINNADLTKADIDEIAALHALKVLILGFGPEGVILADPDLSALKGLKHLEHLQLCIENPAGVRLDFLRFFPKLETLHLHACDYGRLKGLRPLKIDKETAEVVRKLPSLQTLEVHHCELNDEVVSLLVGTGRLTNLSIYSSEITGASLKFVAENKRLTALALSSPNLTDGIGDWLVSLRELTELSVSSDKTTTNLLKSITKMGGLKKLSVRLPHASPADFALLRSLTNLELLRVDECLVSEAAVLELNGHPNLQRLFLNGADASQAARDAIMSLPRIEYGELGNWKFRKPK